MLSGVMGVICRVRGTLAVGFRSILPIKSSPTPGVLSLRNDHDSAWLRLRVRGSVRQGGSSKGSLGQVQSIPFRTPPLIRILCCFFGPFSAPCRHCCHPHCAAPTDERTDRPDRPNRKELIGELQAVEADIALASAATKASPVPKIRRAQRLRFSPPDPPSAPPPSPPNLTTPRARTPRSMVSSLEEYGFEQQDKSSGCAEDGRGRERRTSLRSRRRRQRSQSACIARGQSWPGLDTGAEEASPPPPCASARRHSKGRHKDAHEGGDADPSFGRNVESSIPRRGEEVGGTTGERRAGGGASGRGAPSQPGHERRSGQRGQKPGRLDDSALDETLVAVTPRRKSRHTEGDPMMPATTPSSSRTSTIFGTPSRANVRRRESLARRPPPSPSTPTFQGSAASRRKGFLTPTAASAGKVRRPRNTHSSGGERAERHTSYTHPGWSR